MSNKSHAQTRGVTVNEAGHVIGQDHHRAKFSDHEIDLMLELVADGMPYREVAEKFETSKGFISMIVNGKRRGHVGVEQRQRGPRANRFSAADPLEFDLFT